MGRGDLQKVRSVIHAGQPAWLLCVKKLGSKLAAEFRGAGVNLSNGAFITAVRAKQVARDFSADPFASHSSNTQIDIARSAIANLCGLSERRICSIMRNTAGTVARARSRDNVEFLNVSES